MGKHRIHPGQQLAAFFQRDDGVGEIGRRGIVGDGGDLGLMLGQGAGHRRAQNAPA